MAEGDTRISVSRDALRADLAEMELRLRTFIGAQLEKKADLADLERVEHRVTDMAARVVYRDGPLIKDLKAYESAAVRLAAGDFTAAQKRALHALVDENLKRHVDTGWTSRQRAIAVFSLLISFVMVCVSIYLGVHYAH